MYSFTYVSIIKVILNIRAKTTFFSYLFSAAPLSQKDSIVLYKGSWLKYLHLIHVFDILFTLNVVWSVNWLLSVPYDGIHQKGLNQHWKSMDLVLIYL